MQPFYLPGMRGHMDLPLQKAKNETKTNSASLCPTDLNPEAFRIHYQTVATDRLTAPYTELAGVKVAESPQSGQVIQCKLETTYDEFAVTQRHRSETAAVQEYVSRMLRPELGLLTEIHNNWQYGIPAKQAFAAKAERLILRITPRLNDTSPLVRTIRNIPDQLIDFETAVQAAFPDEFKALENATVYAKSDMTNDAVDAEIAGIFAADPAVPAPVPANLDQNGYLRLPARVTYTDFKRRFAAMPGLLYVMNQIYFKWLSGEVLDRRSNLQQTLRADTPDDPGGIRCVHADTNPGGRVAADLDFAEAQALPAGGPTAYHTHLTQTALYTTQEGDKIRDAAVINTNIRQSGKFAVEYSGIPFAGEHKPHNNKIVFNYLTGEMLVTFDHYHVMVKVDMVN